MFWINIERALLLNECSHRLVSFLRVVLKLYEMGLYLYLFGCSVPPMLIQCKEQVPFLDASLHLYKRVCPSVRPSVCWPIHYTRAKTAFFDCFRPWWGPFLKQMINQHVLRASLTSISFHLSVHPSVSPYMSHDQYMQRLSPDGGTILGRILD